MIHYPPRMTVVEVAPRDGLQSLGRWIGTDTKVAMIDRLSAAGLPVIEVTAFAHPRAIPELRDAEEVFARIARRPGTVYRGLAPNARGAERAVAAGADEILGLVTVSETYSQRNQNMPVQAAAAQAEEAFRIANQAGRAFAMAIGVSMWCPYEGGIPPARVEALVARFVAAGMRRFYLAGSMGMEDARQVGALFAMLRGRWPDCAFGYHVHNLAGTGTANVLAAMDAGAAWIEGAICGIGGGIALPDTGVPVGNLATEDIVAMLSTLGIDTGLRLQEVVAAARDVERLLGLRATSHAARAGTREEILQHARP
ncbi:beta/alpha barrel domain-containing protein [Roseomonas marmotae]|uniref:Hydroxymethylglutaryl-CoA lyase n=1 Tax=Roseomonas marmotae TaxID=2768161 RepID=A0ABS3KIB6_9PROT|nr:hypothetical protein [Roseomonas marmotae]MBO1077190.1 hydroxymethylglutaryl-CoA lyase [Roseomonas marmotae]